MYQKNRDADEWSGVGAASASAGMVVGVGAGANASASGSGSGTHTPAQRRAGAVTITEAKPRVQGGAGAVAGDRGSGRGKAREEKIWDAPKSKEVKRLEGLVEDLKTLQGGGKVVRKESEVECFCQGESGVMGWSCGYMREPFGRLQMGKSGSRLGFRQGAKANTVRSISGGSRRRRWTRTI